jgi:hypothetical protein
MILAIMMACGFAVFLMYHRKKVATLKSVIAHVQYVADPSTDGRHHFDNPVYSMGSSFRNDSFNSRLNNAQIKNNLNINLKENNLNKMRLDDTDSLTYVGTCSTATCSSVISKNVEADGGNPNLYHSIEDLKTDHLYDEIKHKEYDQYDHLNYTRPNGTWKPHYQRMSSTLKDADERDGAKPGKSDDFPNAT